MLEWRVGDSTTSGQSQSRASARDGCRPPLRSAALLAAYVLLLVVASIGGFFIGRWSNNRRVINQAVVERLMVEELAWRSGDAALYGGLLDPVMEPAARNQLLADFRTRSPREIDIVPTGYHVLAGDRLRVEVQEMDAGNVVAREQREYVRRGADWFRAR